MITKEEYEIELDDLKGRCRDIVENLSQELYMPSDAYKVGDAEWCRQLADTLETYRYELENLADGFDSLEEYRTSQEESDEEESDEEE